MRTCALLQPGQSEAPALQEDEIAKLMIDQLKEQLFQLQDQQQLETPMTSAELVALTDDQIRDQYYEQTFQTLTHTPKAVYKQVFPKVTGLDCTLDTVSFQMKKWGLAYT